MPSVAGLLWIRRQATPDFKIPHSFGIMQILYPVNGIIFCILKLIISKNLKNRGTHKTPRLTKIDFNRHFFYKKGGPRIKFYN